MTTTLEFNDKKFDYTKVLAQAKAAINAVFKPTELCLRITAEYLVFTEGSADDELATPIIYMYRGSYLILAGATAVRKAIAEGKEMPAKLYTKHTLAKCEIIKWTAPPESEYFGEQTRTFNNYNRSGSQRPNGRNGGSGGYRGDTGLRGRNGGYNRY